jgi:outer membrane murein-binding lipoprotein Lpp
MRTISPARTTVGAMLTAGLLLAGCGDGAPDDNQQDEIGTLEAELEQAREEAADLRQENEDLRAELAALREHDEDLPAPEDGVPDPPADLRSPEGLVDQLRLRFPPGPVPDEWERATTGWSPFELPDGLDDAYDEPGILAADLLEQLEAAALGRDVWEVTARVYLDPDDPDTATVAVLAWGFADDAVEGRDVRVTATRGAAGWEPGPAEVRHHCRRGATQDDLCV